MEILDFVELQSQRSAAYSIGGMESMRTWAHTVLGLQLGGAGVKKPPRRAGGCLCLYGIDV